MWVVLIVLCWNQTPRKIPNNKIIKMILNLNKIWFTGSDLAVVFGQGQKEKSYELYSICRVFWQLWQHCHSTEMFSTWLQNVNLRMLSEHQPYYMIWTELWEPADILKLTYWSSRTEFYIIGTHGCFYGKLPHSMSITSYLWGPQYGHIPLFWNRPHVKTRMNFLVMQLCVKKKTSNILVLTNKLYP